MTFPTSIILTVAIIGGATVIGSRQQDERASLRRVEEHLLDEARSLGLATKAGKTPVSIQLVSHRREDSHNKSSIFLNAWNEYQGGFSQGETHERAATRLRLIGELERMDAGQLLAIWASLTLRGDEAGFNTLQILSKKYPREFLKAPDALDSFGVTFVPDALRRIASRDPLEALKLLEEVRTKGPNPFLDQARDGILEITVKNDPALAFKILKDLPAAERPEALRQMLCSTEGQNGVSAILPFLRVYSAEFPESISSGASSSKPMNSLAFGVCKDGYEIAAMALANAKLTLAEKTLFIQNVSASYSGKETGSWIDWGFQNLPAEVAQKEARRMIQDWVREDSRAAANWATELPPGKQRSEAVRSVFNNWPAKDPHGKAAFATSHGL